MYYFFLDIKLHYIFSNYTRYVRKLNFRNILSPLSILINTIYYKCFILVIIYYYFYLCILLLFLKYNILPTNHRI